MPVILYRIATSYTVPYVGLSLYQLGSRVRPNQILSSTLNWRCTRHLSWGYEDASASESSNSTCVCSACQPIDLPYNLKEPCHTATGKITAWSHHVSLASTLSRTWPKRLWLSESPLLLALSCEHHAKKVFDKVWSVQELSLFVCHVVTTQ